MKKSVMLLVSLTSIFIIEAKVGRRKQPNSDRTSGLSKYPQSNYYVHTHFQGIEKLKKDLKDYLSPHDISKIEKSIDTIHTILVEAAHKRGLKDPNFKKTEDKLYNDRKFSSTAASVWDTIKNENKTIRK